MMKPTLEVVRATKTQRICEIKGADFHIGRLPNLDLFIDDNRISRPHARIQRLPDGSYDLMDLDSQNGTHLGGKKLAPFQPVRLRDGDRIKIVEYELIFHQPGPVVHEPQDDGTTVVGSLHDLSSDHLVKRSKHPAEALKAILDVVRALGGGADLGEVLSRALDGLMDVFPQAERGFRARGVALSSSLARQALDASEAMLVTELPMKPPIDDWDIPYLEPIRAWLCVPLLGLEGRPVGLIQLFGPAFRANFQGVATRPATLAR